MLFNSNMSFNLEGVSVAVSQFLINYKFEITSQTLGQVYSRNNGTLPDLVLNSGQGIALNGVDQKLPINNITTTSTMSICFNISDFSLTGSQSEVFSEATGRFRVMVKDGKIQVDFRDAGGDADIFVTSILPTNARVTLVASAGGFTSYVDGVEDLSVSQPFAGMLLNLIGSGNYTRYLLATLTDLFVFEDVLTPQEIVQYSERPNDFFQDAQDGVIDNCILNIPCDGINENVIDYTDDTQYQVASYTNSVRDNAKQLPYGTQESNFIHVDIGIPKRGDKSLYEEHEHYEVLNETVWTPPALFQVEEVVKIGTEIIHYVFDSNGNKFTNGVADGVYTIPIADVVLNNTTFDGTIGVILRKVFRVRDNLDIPASDLYTGYLASRMQYNLLVDGDGRYLIDDNGTILDDGE